MSRQTRGWGWKGGLRREEGVQARAFHRMTQGAGRGGLKWAKNVKHYLNGPLSQFRILRILLSLLYFENEYLTRFCGFSIVHFHFYF
jgi:hypothetical protein